MSSVAVKEEIVEVFELIDVNWGNTYVTSKEGRVVVFIIEVILGLIPILILGYRGDTSYWTTPIELKELKV